MAELAPRGYLPSTCSVLLYTASNTTPAFGKMPIVEVVQLNEASVGFIQSQAAEYALSRIKFWFQKLADHDKECGFEGGCDCGYGYGLEILGIMPPFKVYHEDEPDDEDAIDLYGVETEEVSVHG